MKEVIHESEKLRDISKVDCQGDKGDNRIRPGYLPTSKREDKPHRREETGL